MERPAKSSDLETADWGRVHEFRERFEKACQQTTGEARPVDLTLFLPPAQDPLRGPVLRQLIIADLEVRWRRRQDVRLESYLQQFPELGTAATLPAFLVYEEYRVRNLYGDQPALTSYQPRFPDQFPELERLVAQQPVQTLGTLIPSTSDTPRIAQADAGERKSAPPPSALPSGLVSGKTEGDAAGVLPVGGGYKLIKCIGRGAFGEVWHAEAPGGVEVAVKIIFGSVSQEDAAKRELQSLELMKRLRHAYLLPIHASWQMEDRLVIAMELADGCLRDCLKQRRQIGDGGVPAEELLRYFREAAEAIDYLHSKQVLHRDIKPENILLLGGHAKVADFGLARVLEESGRLIQASTAGTPAFMAPEIMWQGKVGEASDQYSLAAAYAELRLDRPLFPGRNMFELMQDNLTRKPDLAPLPAAEQLVLHKALAKEPELRYKSCRAFIEALDEALAPPPPSPVPPPAVPPPSRWRGLAVTAVGTSVLVALGLMVAYWLLRPPFDLEAPPPLALHAGEVKTLTVRCQRVRSKEPLQFTFAGVPAHVTIPDGTLAADRDTFSADVSTEPDAVPGSQQVTVRAALGSKEQRVAFTLTIEPRVYHLPPQWEKADNAQSVSIDGKVYYDRINVLKQESGISVPFVLIPRDPARRNASDTFYMMETKVSVGLYRKFADGTQGLNSGWEKFPVNHGKRFPIMGVVWADARKFAQWLAEGDLPTRDQWDQAAGRFLPPEQRGRGPFLDTPDGPGPAPVAINQKEPAELDKPSRDISPFHVRHMAGNGFEWTRDPAGVDQSAMWLRGRSYAADRPLLFTDLEEERKTNLGAWPRTLPRETIGFRVVIEP